MPSYSGWSGIFAFPYRIQAKEVLLGCEVKGGELWYRIYPPFLRRTKASPITDDVPLELWPNFGWHAEVPAAVRSALIAPISIIYENAVVYDGLRIDVQRSEKSDPVLAFVKLAMRWLRVFCGQPWIGALDHHFEPTLKRIFKIDSEGKAASELHPVASMVAVPYIRLVDNEMWRAAFDAAAKARVVPVYWDLFFDALNALADSDYARFVMILAMALESCRDQTFSKVYPTKSAGARGPKLVAPFDHTDLLKHLSENAETTFRRNFAAEKPEYWASLKNLYVARHHVAHGGAPVYPDSLRRLVSVGQKNSDPLREAARAAIVWMEMVSGTRVHPLVPGTEERSIRVSLATQ